jgi:hypothetical protein
VRNTTQEGREDETEMKKKKQDLLATGVVHHDIVLMAPKYQVNLGKLPGEHTILHLTLQPAGDDIEQREVCARRRLPRADSLQTTTPYAPPRPPDV